MSQVPSEILELYDQGITAFASPAELESRDSIPTRESDYPLTGTKWLKINGVICVFLDMKNSSQLTADYNVRDAASIYQSFVDTGVRILDIFGASYIDVRGDGAFGLFDRNLPYHALAAAVSFKTFVEDYLLPIAKERFEGIDIGAHIGIDQNEVLLVKRIGLKNQEGETDKQNEVWAGKTVNMSAKLASIGQRGEMVVSPRFYARIQNRYALSSCECHGDPVTGKPKSLWEKRDVSNDHRFDFTYCWVMKTHWCDQVGEGYMGYLLNEDK